MKDNREYLQRCAKSVTEPVPPLRRSELIRREPAGWRVRNASHAKPGISESVASNERVPSRGVSRGRRSCESSPAEPPNRARGKVNDLLSPPRCMPAGRACRLAAVVAATHPPLPRVFERSRWSPGSAARFGCLVTSLVTTSGRRARFSFTSVSRARGRPPPHWHASTLGEMRR